MPEVTAMTIAAAHQWITEQERGMPADQREIAGEVLKELQSRLQFMLNVGLHYLTLDRSAPTLSGAVFERRNAGVRPQQEQAPQAARLVQH